MKNETGAGNPALRRYRRPRRHQQGVVLLALILVVLVGSSYILVSKLNQRAQDYARDVQTRVALKEAKQALIQYAVSYPELHEDSSRIAGPGYLPCPDQEPGAAPDYTGDMVAETNCAESTGTNIGRLPTRDLGLDNLVDAAGERLWYAVAQEYKNNQSSGHVMNSETPASLRLDGDDDEIVAVVIAPGAPINGQDGRGDAVDELYADPTPTKDWHEVVAEYLEDDNATTTDGEFVTVPTASGSASICTDGSLDEDQIEQQCFNDTLITITRRELMAAVEARVAGDVRSALAGWRTQAGGAFPWLAPFRDPKRGGRYGAGLGGYGVAGFHTSGTTSSTTLTDTGAQFIAMGVNVGDRVWNVTDGSYGTVSARTATTVTVASLVGGSDNDFFQQDRYFIEVAAPALGTGFTGAAAAASSGTHLEAAVDLESYGVVPGDIVDEIDTSTGAIESTGTVTSVDGNEVELDPISGADFDPVDTWRVRSAIGVASAGSTGTTLEDTSTNFATVGVTAGDLVRNLTDGSLGVVDVDPTGTQLTVTSLYGGADNTFQSGDNYALVRNIPETFNRAGLLPVHELGKPFVTDLAVKWSLTLANGNSIYPMALTDMPTGAASTYYTAVRNWIQGSTLYSDSPTDDDSYPDAVSMNSDVNCAWAGMNVVLCDVSYADTQFLNANVDSVTLTGSIYSITDTGSRFNYSGVRSGAKIQNLSQNLNGIVHAASSTTQNVVNAVAIDDGSTPFTASADDEIRVLVASKRTPATGGHIADGATAPNLACYTGANFDTFVEPGDTIRLNSSTYGNPIGSIIDPITSDCVTYTDLQGGTATTISAGQSFRILYDFVEQRRWQFRVRMAGNVGATNPSIGVMERSVCQGFGTDCDSQSADALYVADNTTPLVKFEDFDVGGTSLGTASVTVPAVAYDPTSPCSSYMEPCGSISISGLTLLMAEDDDEVTAAASLPRWFLRNRWHEYAFASYSDVLSPENSTGPAADCTTGTSCLTVTMQDLPGPDAHTDRRAVVVMAGQQLSGQSRGAGTLGSYFEDENAVEETSDPAAMHYLFEQAPVSNTFNDQLSAVTQ